MLLFRKLSHWMWWNDVICERVVLDNLVVNIFKWEECELTQDGLSAAASLSLLPSCRGDVQPSQSFFRSNGQIVILRTRMYFISPVVAGVAENARRPLVWLDLLDVIHHQEDYIQQLQKIFEDVQKIEAYLYLVNFAPLVAKRSYEDRRGCVEIRRFLDLLRSYHGVVFICLSRHDETDPVLDTMGPVELKLHDCQVGRLLCMKVVETESMTTRTTSGNALFGSALAPETVWNASFGAVLVPEIVFDVVGGIWKCSIIVLHSTRINRISKGKAWSIERIPSKLQKRIPYVN
ncbi:hypothetical protein CFRS1_v010557 [Colletotrichum fructicola]|nr:hypothetical protein CFRS1_v010557 [Colletotrichum fructicola]